MFPMGECRCGGCWQALFQLRRGVLFMWQDSVVILKVCASHRMAKCWSWPSLKPTPGFSTVCKTWWKGLCQRLYAPADSCWLPCHRWQFGPSSCWHCCRHCTNRQMHKSKVGGDGTKPPVHRAGADVLGQWGSSLLCWWAALDYTAQLTHEEACPCWECQVVTGWNWYNASNWNKGHAW